MIWVTLGVFVGALVLRWLGAPGAVTWTLLALAIVALIVTGRPEGAALVGVAGLLGLGGGVIVRSLRPERAD